jgi:hypothetical protein
MHSLWEANPALLACPLAETTWHDMLLCGGPLTVAFSVDERSSRRRAMNDGTTRQRVEHFWQTMNTNDWQAVGALLPDDYVLVYPQSSERFRGRERFIALNS